MIEVDQRLNPERAGLLSAETRLKQARQTFEDAQKSLKQAQTDFRKEVLDLLGGTKEDPLACRAVSILDSADAAGIDPKWLYYQLDRTAHLVQKQSNEYQPNPPPISEDPSVYYLYAISLITTQTYGNKMYRDLAGDALEKAAELAKKTTDQDLAKKLEVAYYWLSQNISILYDIHSKWWWDHY